MVAVEFHFVEPLVAHGDILRGERMHRSIKRTSAVRWLAVVALTVDIMRMQLRGTQAELGALNAIRGNDMQGGYSGLTEIYYEHTTKPGRIPRVNKALSKRQALRDQRLDFSG
jgi:hypothetical protein